MLRVGCDCVGVTVWDTSGLSSYASLRPLVYRDCSVVLLCYAAGGLPRLRGWAAEVRLVSNPDFNPVLLGEEVLLCPDSAGSNEE